MTKIEFIVLIITASATLFNLFALLFLFLSKAHAALVEKYVGTMKAGIVSELNGAFVNVENRFKGIESKIFSQASSVASKAPVSAPAVSQPSNPVVSPPAV